jgi:hypothetical protein
MKRLNIAAAVVLLTLTAGSTAAQRIRLDDSLSPTDTYPVTLSWSAGDITQALNALMAGTADAGPPLTGLIPDVEVRLDTRDFVGRAARIYLTLPPLSSGMDSTADFELRWDASEQFLSGAVRPGQSTLVFDGTIEDRITSAVFDFLLVMESDASADSFDVEPIYELEVLP